MRLRTLPVSLAGVVSAAAMALIYKGSLLTVPFVLCAVFACLAQIASNFANEYFDYRDGVDTPGRVGFRRGVTEGDITPRAMFIATLVTLALACLVGLGLVVYGGWWLVAIGVIVALGALAYSAGPYPLSRHGLGEVAVILFFGVVPVTLTYWLTTGLLPNAAVWCASLGVGLMGANVLVINNYRDREDDAKVNKRTLAVRFDKPTRGKFSIWQYVVNAVAGVGLTFGVWWHVCPWSLLLPVIFFGVAYLPLCRKLAVKEPGAWLNPMLGATARAMALYALLLLAVALSLLLR